MGEKVKRPRATEFLLDTLGKGRSVAEYHGDKQVGDRRIVDPFDQSLSQPGAGAEGERHEGVAWVLSQNLRVIPVFNTQEGENALVRRPCGAGSSPPRCPSFVRWKSKSIQVSMHKPDGNRTLDHSGGNALDRTVPHVASYLLARLAHLIVQTDAAGPCAHHSNQVTAVFLH
jgi:hypothetical protein